MKKIKKREYKWNGGGLQMWITDVGKGVYYFGYKWLTEHRGSYIHKLMNLEEAESEFKTNREYYDKICLPCEVEITEKEIS